MKTAKTSDYTTCSESEVSLNAVTEENFLRKIMYSLGLDSKECDELNKELFIQRRLNMSDNCETRINLTKLVVRQCIHRISSKIFAKRESEISGQSYFPNRSLLKLPLSLRTVYTLVTVHGFCENDVAFILNIDTMKVHDRLSKATHFLKQLKSPGANN